jgi:hypothetical protein
VCTGRHRATEVDGEFRFGMVEFVPSQITGGYCCAGIVLAG